MPEPPSDAELVKGCRAGEDKAWDELVERYSRYVYAICAQGFRLTAHEFLNAPFQVRDTSHD